jgi:16S rRNA (uracil1498-N3)-methyltransferase
VILSACEQSGRTRVPILTAAQGLEVFLATSAAPAADEGEITKLVLSPGAIQSLREIAIKRRVVLAVGPEGGFAQPELPLLQHAGFQPVRLGPRIFRTETAALVALSILQSLAGDL